MKTLTDVQRKEIETKIEELKNEESDLIEGEKQEYYKDEFNEFNDCIDPEEEYYSSPAGRLDVLAQEIESNKKILWEDNYWKNIINYAQKYNDNLKLYKTGTIIPDSSQIIVDDAFDREKYAILLAQMIDSKKERGSFNIGVLGKWGIGKTSFLNLIKNNFSNKPNIYVINYNASEYEETERIWLNIAQKLFEQFEKEKFFSEVIFCYGKIKKNIRKIFKKIMLYFIVFVIDLLLILFSKYLFSMKNIYMYISGVMAGCGSILIAFQTVIIPFSKRIFTFTFQQSERVYRQTKLPSYNEKLGTRTKVTGDIDILLDVWLKGTNKKIVFFVDELDRCSDKGIIEFFQSIQILIENKYIDFIFAIDPDCLKRAFENCYKIKENEAKRFVNEYLDKYVSLIIPLDNYLNYDRYIDSILEKTAANCFDSDEIIKIKECVTCIRWNEVTPRKVKKIINALIMAKEFCVKNINKKYAINFQEYLSWYIFSVIYREEANMILELYDESKQYFPLSEVLKNRITTETKMHIECKKYIEIIKEYSLININLYNHIALQYKLDVI